MRCGAKNEETKKSPLANYGLTKRFFLYGGAKEDRTPDLQIANLSLSQLSYNPKNKTIIGKNIEKFKYILYFSPIKNALLFYKKARRYLT